MSPPSDLTAYGITGLLVILLPTGLLKITGLLVNLLITENYWTYCQLTDY